ncbi:MAG: hypothetical protein HY906_18025 [Deltaproteobacteria bacterium]|nr:hypothetical protein [Deltaproteobacteria bacterium]
MPADGTIPVDVAAEDATAAADGAPATDGGMDSGSSFAGTCHWIKQGNPDASDGFYFLSSPPIPVYCDMTTDGGGWTLVGRSVKGASPASFGWYEAAGSVEDDSAPYSLGPLSVGLLYDEVLVTRYTSGKKPGHNAFKVRFYPANVCRITSCPIFYVPARVLGNCDPPGGPAMLTHLGYLEVDRAAFWMRDREEGIAADLQVGLYPDGFRLGGTDCAATGELGGEQGMIFVR